MKELPAETFFESLCEQSRATRVPEGVTFELTYGCNLRCVHCYNPTHRALPQELTTDEVFSLLKELAELGIVRLTFTGGELFTRSDVFDILHHAKRLGFLLSLISNATRVTPIVADALEEIGFDTIDLSIYGATQDTYERVTNVPGSYELFLRGLRSLASKGLPVVVAMPVLTTNANDLHDARALVEGFGFKFRYCLDVTPKTDGDTGPLRYRLSAEDKVRINADMVGYTSAGSAVSACATDRAFISCSCGHSRFAITPYGEMNLCVAFPIPKYNLRTGTVREGWDILKQTVDQAQPNEQYQCPSCEVRSFCRQGRSDAWLETGDMSRCLPHFKQFAHLEQSAHAHLDPRRPR